MKKNLWFDTMLPIALCFMLQLAFFSLSVFKESGEAYTAIFLTQLFVSIILFAAAGAIHCSLSIAFCSSILVAAGGFTQTAISSTHEGFEDGSQTFMMHMLVGTMAFLAVILFMNCGRNKILKIFYVDKGLNLLTAAGIVCYLAAIAGNRIAGAANWIFIEGISIQVTELAKIIYFWILGICANSMGEREIRRIIVLYLIQAFFLLIASEFGFLILITVTTAIVLMISVREWAVFVSGLRKYICLIAAAMAGIAVFGILKREIFVRSLEKVVLRFSLMINPEADPYGLGYQMIQGEKAILRGGLWGTGLETYVPVLDSDMVFVIMIELFGVVLAAAILTLFWHLCTKAAKDSFMRGSALGITLAVSMLVQALYNAAAAAGLLPLSGMTMPFISMGGTSYIISMILLAIIFSTAGESYKYADAEENRKEERKNEDRKVIFDDKNVHLYSHGSRHNFDDENWCVRSTATGTGRKKNRSNRRSEKSENPFWDNL